jgi:hypothetical protein
MDGIVRMHLLVIIIAHIFSDSSSVSLWLLQSF